MLIQKIIKFYLDGFKSMRLGKTLWLVILIKLFVIIFILKIFFFSDTIDTKFHNKEDRIDFIYENITKEIK
ncbi:MAG: DUF4492 domain-containing protein [Campylobacter sputorum]|uniref:DUF4492 domain-containing protein n=1 Tax=Campylobacter sputorum TaxID=206 RepID=UPI000B777E39|nr:DUF4492 domain-containing protein [Campylobacter sputorum]MDY6121168.1 DUF4492 domain-containing protein [Campylobacter sputorum]